MTRRAVIALFGLWIALAAPAAAQAVSPQLDRGQLDRGRALYAAHCLVCHQVTGLGTTGVFPPLAKSDFISQNRTRSILAVVGGLEGPITVNGRKYDGAMPPANLNDREAADVLTYVFNSWGNSQGAVTPEEVKTVRAQSPYPTYEDLARANSYAPLPPAPPGLALREVARLTEHGIRIVGDGLGTGLYVLGGRGDVWHLNPADGSLRQILWGRNYLDRQGRDTSTWGLALDARRRLFIAANRRDESGILVTNFVTIYRTTELEDDHPREPVAWFASDYPWGVGPFNHCVNELDFGPDGALYVNSGSRTDGNEPGESPRFWKGGEHPNTACLWRLDPAAERPSLEIFARGLRNAFGFCWNDRGEMFATDNGPDADAPEELNLIERGQHYGFPYQFSDWTRRPYPYTPDPPAGVVFRHPIANLGPDAGFAGSPISTFDPHSSPAGVVFLGQDFPEPYRGTLLVARVGNLIKRERDVGFDVLQMRLEKRGGSYVAHTRALLPGLGRPIDLFADGRGRVYILEYTRPVNNAGSLGFPGRILELSVARPAS